WTKRSRWNIQSARPAAMMSDTTAATIQPRPWKTRSRRTWPRRAEIRDSRRRSLIDPSRPRRAGPRPHENPRRKQDPAVQIWKGGRRRVEALRRGQQRSYHLSSLAENPLQRDHDQEKRQNRPGVPERDRRVGVQGHLRRPGQVVEQGRGRDRRVEFA